MDNTEKNWKNGFNQGYACACAVYVQQRGHTTEADDMFACNPMSIEEMMECGVDEHDIKILTPVVKEFQRKRSNQSADKSV